MAGTELGRLITAMVTPFADDGSVNYDQLGRLAGQLIVGGSDALLVTGTTGESPTLSHEEKLECYRTVMAAADGRVPVVAGTGNYSTGESVAFSQEAEALGVDALLLVVPYYNNPPQEGLYQHFRDHRGEHVAAVHRLQRAHAHGAQHGSRHHGAPG